MSSRVGKSDLAQTLKAQTAVLDELKREQEAMRRLMEEREDQHNMERSASEDLKRSYSKQIHHLIKEVEKL